MKIVYYFLKAFLILFTLFGLLGILGMATTSGDTTSIIIMCIWSLIGILLLILLSKHKASFVKSNIPLPTNTHIDNSVSEKNISDINAESASNTDSNSTITAESIYKNIDSLKSNNFSIIVPKSKNGEPMQYSYRNQEILDLDFDVAMKSASENSWELSAQSDGNRIALYSGADKIGYLGGTHVDMLHDWINRNDPYTIYLEGIYSENKTGIAYLVFYRDNRKYMSFREQTIVKLTNFRKEDSQMVIPFLNGGEELDLSEQYNDNSGTEYISVEESSVEIGRLPKKASDRYFNEGAAACYFDHSDYDDEKDVYIPYVVIYW